MKTMEDTVDTSEGVFSPDQLSSFSKSTHGHSKSKSTQRKPAAMVTDEVNLTEGQHRGAGRWEWTRVSNVDTFSDLRLHVTATNSFIVIM